MESISESLLAALDQLDADKLKRFKWHLKDYTDISASDLNKADGPDTVDIITQCFGPEEAVKITVDMLRKMKQNYVADELEEKQNQVGQSDSSDEDDDDSSEEKDDSDEEQKKPSEGDNDMVEDLELSDQD